MELLCFTEFLLIKPEQGIPRQLGTISLYRYRATSSNHHQLIPPRHIPLAHHLALHRPLRRRRDSA